MMQASLSCLQPAKLILNSEFHERGQITHWQKGRLLFPALERTLRNSEDKCVSGGL